MIVYQVRIRTPRGNWLTIGSFPTMAAAEARMERGGRPTVGDWDTAEVIEVESTPIRMGARA